MHWRICLCFRDLGIHQSISPVLPPRGSLKGFFLEKPNLFPLPPQPTFEEGIQARDSKPTLPLALPLLLLDVCCPGRIGYFAVVNTSLSPFREGPHHGKGTCSLLVASSDFSLVRWRLPSPSHAPLWSGWVSVTVLGQSKDTWEQPSHRLMEDDDSHTVLVLWFWVAGIFLRGCFVSEHQERFS